MLLGEPKFYLLKFFHPQNYFPDKALAGRQANIIGKNLQNMGEEGE